MTDRRTFLVPGTQPGPARLVFVWNNFGPMHADRLEAVAQRFPDAKVHGIELFDRDVTYDWVGDDRPGFDKTTLFAMDEAPGLARRTLRLLRAAWGLRRHSGSCAITNAPRCWPRRWSCGCAGRGCSPWAVRNSTTSRAAPAVNGSRAWRCAPITGPSARRKDPPIISAFSAAPRRQPLQHPVHRPDAGTGGGCAPPCLCRQALDHRRPAGRPRRTSPWRLRPSRSIAPAVGSAC